MNDPLNFADAIPALISIDRAVQPAVAIVQYWQQVIAAIVHA